MTPTYFFRAALTDSTLEVGDVESERRHLATHVGADSALVRWHVPRKAYPTVPPKVDHRLTVLGRSLLTKLELLIVWADIHHNRVRKAYVPPVAATAL